MGDNIDKNVKPRTMTSEHQTRSLHYFHLFAVRDRIDLSSYSNEPRVPDLTAMNLDDLLPSSEDEELMNENLAILMGRVLRKYMPFFQKFAFCLGRHIFHEFYEDLSAKSDVV